MSAADFAHQPVLLEQVLAGLQIQPSGLYLDGTVGGGGHAAAILEAGGPACRLIGLDQDNDALAAAAIRLAAYGERVRLLQSNFAAMEQALAGLGLTDGSLDGVLLDIGVSSYQLDAAERGFSYMQDALLDMRMNRERGQSAADLVNQLSVTQLTQLIYEYGEENWAKRIAEFIVAERPIQTTGQLVTAIKKAVPVGAREKDQHPAKRTFQALRIAVNDELAVLEQGLEAAQRLLRPGGRLAVISFHSLEDRIVKEKYRHWASACVCPRELPVCVCGHRPEVKIINRKPIVATAIEVAANPRARSAKLRIAEKLPLA